MRKVEKYPVSAAVAATLPFGMRLDKDRKSKRLDFFQHGSQRAFSGRVWEDHIFSVGVRVSDTTAMLGAGTFFSLHEVLASTRWDLAWDACRVVPFEGTMSERETEVDSSCLPRPGPHTS